MSTRVPCPITLNKSTLKGVGAVCSKFVCSKADRRNARKIFEHIFSRISHLRNARKKNARKYLLELGTSSGNWKLGTGNWELRCQIFFAKMPKSQIPGSISHKLANFTFSYNKNMYSSLSHSSISF